MDRQVMILFNVSVSDTVRSVEPFNMPKEVFDELFQDYVVVGQENGILNINTDEATGTTLITYDYALLVIHANK